MDAIPFSEEKAASKEARGTLRLLVCASLVVAIVAGLFSLSSTMAAQSGDGGFLLTVVARHCPTYGDITANLARNNIMESLRDLGKDSPYESGDLMDAGIEAQAQPNCEPLSNWTFTLGDDHQTKAKVGPWGALSIVLHPFDTDLTTEAETDLLNPQGLPTGKKIKGATTVRLSDAEAQLAAKQSLWIQGGTPEDPILAQRYPGPRFGFGALRCAVDDVNGDNVEYIAYPDGVTHVFCFAYYVEPPPTSGTIIVRKQISGEGGWRETFPFEGNTSYNPGGRFDLTAAPGHDGETSFFRGATAAGTPPWTLREVVPADWKLADLSCESRDGTSGLDTDRESAEAKVSLGAGDVVTCTYADEYAPPPRGLVIRKITEGGVGHFSYSVKPVGGGSERHAEATTAEEGIAVDADPAPIDVAGGRYEIGEHSPASAGGEWKLVAVECDGEHHSIKRPIEVTVPEHGVRSCTFTNRFVPRGSIGITKVTKGDTGTSSFVIYRQGGDLAEYKLSAHTTEEGVPQNAHGDPTDDLELGEYKIIDFPPPPGEGEWSLSYVQCDGKAVPFAQGRIEIELTAGDPHRHCTFVNRFDPTPPPDPKGPQPPSPTAGLVVSKEASEPTVTVGGAVAYRLTVSNRGPNAARSVRLIDQPLGGASLVSARTLDGGHCRQRLPVTCRLGRLRAGRRKAVEVRLRLWQPGLLLNLGVAGTTTQSLDLGNGKDEAGVRVKAVNPHPFPLGLG